MGKRPAPPPPEVLRKSGPHRDRTRYDRERQKQEDRRRPPDDVKSPEHSP